MGTSTPVFPNGRTGMLAGSPEASASVLQGAKMVPKPTVPATFKKSLRDGLCLFFNIAGFPLKADQESSSTASAMSRPMGMFWGH
jgi:hypothetical protein